MTTRVRSRRWRSPAAILADDQGSTDAIEFVLVFPILLTIVAVIVQLALLFVGSIVVQYAAYNAARAAIVWLPAELEGEKRNKLPKDEKKTSAKLEHVERAAEISCIPITPAISNPFAGTWGGAPADTVDVSKGSIALRWALSMALTSVELDKREYAEQDPITVTVEHTFIMRVPIAARLLGAGLISSAVTEALPSWLPVPDPFAGVQPYVKSIRASATLLNQGRIQGPQ